MEKTKREINEEKVERKRVTRGRTRKSNDLYLKNQN